MKLKRRTFLLISTLVSLSIFTYFYAFLRGEDFNKVAQLRRDSLAQKCSGEKFVKLRKISPEFERFALVLPEHRFLWCPVNSLSWFDNVLKLQASILDYISCACKLCYNRISARKQSRVI